MQLLPKHMEEIWPCDLLFETKMYS